MAFVIIQHLSPDHKSIMGQILKKDTRMPVLEIQDGMKPELNCVYFNPPNREVAIYQGVFHLVEPAETRYSRLPIDYFFRSLAQDLEEKAICIVLSGTGSDGTLGLEAVKGAGGMTMAQEEEQAKYPFMPRSAIDTGLVDYVLPVEEMPEELIRYVKHPYLESRERELTPDSNYQNFLGKILMLVRASTKHDFSHYKQTTIRRRLGRRMAVHKIEGIADYFRYLQQNPAEVQTLFKDLVICVTSFFRDPEAFKALETKVIPDILARKPDNAPIRIWVAGCGTGEEALSIAILLAEAMERMEKRYQVQIFATDVDQEAIDKARAGVYPESIGADVSSDRLQRFFIKNEGKFKIKQEIREMVVYAVQNLISDPPFSGLELISCRNVLIYFDNESAETTPAPVSLHPASQRLSVFGFLGNYRRVRRPVRPDGHQVEDFSTQRFGGPPSHGIPDPEPAGGEPPAPGESRTPAGGRPGPHRENRVERIHPAQRPGQR